MNRDFEQRVINMILDGNNVFLSQLRQQYLSSKIVKTSSNSAGFFITYKITDPSLKLSSKVQTFNIGDLYGSIKGVPYAVGFILFIKDGFLLLLEGYTNAIDIWPSDDADITLAYLSSENRDVEQLFV